MILSTYTTLEIKEILPYNITLGSKESLIAEPISIVFSTLISTVAYSLVPICNYSPTQASSAWIRPLDKSTELEVSTSASSTLQDKNFYEDENPSTDVGQLLLLVWPWYDTITTVWH